MMFVELIIIDNNQKSIHFISVYITTVKYAGHEKW